jgi:hypothetical protein
LTLHGAVQCFKRTAENRFPIKNILHIFFTFLGA